MRVLLLLLIAALALGDIFSLDLSLAPGLSVKNAVLYLVILALFFRTVIAGELNPERSGIKVMFAVWIAYAAVTLCLAAFVIHYPGYRLGDAVITLKSYLIDPALFCFAALWGLRDEKDVRLIVSALAGVMVISSFFTLLDVAGIVHLNIYVGDSGVQEGRVFGVFGHANETGTLLACFLPALFAETTSSRGFGRAFWLIGTAASITVFLMTISRGAFAGLFVGLLWGGYLCRRHVPLQRLVLWAIIIAAAVPIGLAIASAIDPYLRGYLAERLFGQSMSLSVGEISSGRTGLWSRIFDQMLNSPASLLLGFGWNVYSTTPYLLPTHNHYLDLWFNLGLVGIGAFALIMRRGIVAALQAIPLASDRDRPMFVAYVFGMLALLVALFFANLFRPWPYIWLYFGAMLRGALIAQAHAAERRVPAPLATTTRVRTSGRIPARPQPAVTWSRRG